MTPSMDGQGPDLYEQIAELLRGDPTVSGLTGGKVWTYNPALDLCAADGCGHSGTVHPDGPCDECHCQGYDRPFEPSFTFEVIEVEEADR